MFTGIIERTSYIKGTVARGRVRVVTIAKPASWKLKKGQSVAVNGICSTVVSSVPGGFTVEYMPETLRHTTAKTFQKDTPVNLERSLKYGDRMDGHVVQGHIEGVGRVEKITKEGRSVRLTLAIPRTLARYVVPRGSIAIDGVSLTIAECRGARVTVALIPHTWAHTTLGLLTKGFLVNIETDIMARHQRLMKPRGRVNSHAAKTLRKSR